MRSFTCTVAALAMAGKLSMAQDEDACKSAHSTEPDCLKDAKCSWCKSAAVPSDCVTKENAKKLRSAVFECSGVSATLNSSMTKEVGSCGGESPSKVEDCKNTDFGSCGNACCRLEFAVNEDPLAAMQMLNASLSSGGPDGSFALQPTAQNTIGFSDVRQFHPPGGYEFVGQVHHTTSGEKHFVDVVNFNIRPNRPSSGSIIRAFSLSLIAGALGDNGQNYKNIQLAMKSTKWTRLSQSDTDGSCPSPSHVVV